MWCWEGCDSRERCDGREGCDGVGRGVIVGRV